MHILLGHILVFTMNISDRFLYAKVCLDALLLRLDARIALSLHRTEIHDLSTIIKAAIKAHVVWSVLASAVSARRKVCSLERMMGTAVCGMSPRVSHSYNHNGRYYIKSIRKRNRKAA